MGGRKVAFIVQRCGVAVNGGAEVHCLTVARKMSAHWNCEILTTCAIDYASWANVYPPGQEYIDGLVVRRFPVEAERDVRLFNSMSSNVLNKRNSASPAELESWLQAQGPWCPALIEYLEEHSADYDAFIFFTYLYWPTVKGLPLVADRAILVPLAHDEWTFYLPVFKELFETSKRFIFNTPEEKDLIQKLYPTADIKGPIIGFAVERPGDIDPLRFRRQTSLQDGFLLYIGRIDPSKGCGELFEFFLRSRNEGRNPRKLVLLGTGMMWVPDHPDILALGFVSEQTKWDALAACDALMMPSPHESLSIAVLEAWAVGKPVIVNGRCAVLVGQCRRANGGLWYESYEQWTEVISLLRSGRVASVLGRQGWRFARKHYDWKVIERQYVDLIEDMMSAPLSASSLS